MALVVDELSDDSCVIGSPGSVVAGLQDAEGTEGDVTSDALR